MVIDGIRPLYGICVFFWFLSFSPFSLSLSKAMKLTTDLINESPSHINPLKDRELVLRGGWKNRSIAKRNSAQSHMMVLQI